MERLATGEHLVERSFTSPEGFSIVVHRGWYEAARAFGDFLGHRSTEIVAQAEAEAADEDY